MLKLIAQGMPGQAYYQRVYENILPLAILLSKFLIICLPTDAFKWGFWDGTRSLHGGTKSPSRTRRGAGAPLRRILNALPPNKKLNSKHDLNIVVNG